MALPFLKFYPSNWRADPGVRASSLAARGFWTECLFLMHESVRRGYLLIAGRAPSDRDLAVQMGVTGGEVKRYRRELLEKGVAAQTEEGVLFSRKMVRDEIRRHNGAHGGNPALRPPSSDNQEPPDSDNREPPSSDNQEPPSSDNREPPSLDNREPPSLDNREPPSPARVRDRARPPQARDLETRSQIRTGGVLSRTEDGADTEEPPPALWRRLWDARWPEGICRTSHAELTELERLAVDLGRAEVVARVGRYFATSDDWLLEHKHPLRTFLRQINSYETPASEREPAVLKRLLWRAVGQDGRMWLEAASVTRTGACVRLETSVPDKLAPYHDTFLEAVREELGGDVELAIVAAEEGGA